MLKVIIRVRVSNSGLGSVFVGNGHVQDGYKKVRRIGLARRWKASFMTA